MRGRVVVLAVAWALCTSSVRAQGTRFVPGATTYGSPQWREAVSLAVELPTCDASRTWQVRLAAGAGALYWCDGVGPGWTALGGEGGPDTTCLDAGVTCLFAASASEGGAATTAAAASSDPANCAAGSLAAGVSASWAAEGCADPVLESELASLGDLNAQLGTNLADGPHTTDTDDQAAGEVAYTPAVGGDWTDPDPTTAAAALDALAARPAGVSDHGALSGLGDDDHAQYGLLAGRSGGQTIYGGTGAGQNLTLLSTSHATKGKVLLGAGGVSVDSAGVLALPLGGSGSAPTLSWSDVGVYEAAAGRAYWCRRSGGNCPFEVNLVGGGGAITSFTTGRPYVDMVATTGYSWKNDTTTGLVWNSAGDQTLAAGGVAVVRMTATKATVLGTGHHGTRASAPATCTVGDLYSDTSGALCFCGATNTWSMVWPSAPTTQNCS